MHQFGNPLSVMTRKPKRPLASWTRAFPEQHKALHPERTQAGGIKARSQSESVRQAVYMGIRDLFLTQHPMCECCEPIAKCLSNWHDAFRLSLADGVHHSKGRSGYLLFDVRYWKAACNACHVWIHNHPAEAMKLKLLSKDWNRQ